MLDSIYKIFTMFGGLAVFMFGMKIMGDNLEALAGNNVKKLFSKISSNRFKGVGVGMGVTAIIQSSSATTVMCVGFVNVGLLSLSQATAIIMGSNIGTTITAQLSSLSALNITAIMSLVAACGLFMTMFSKKDSINKIGVIFMGLGMLFIGLSIMSSSLKTFAYDSAGNPSEFATFMLTKVTNPFVCILVGALFTAVIQSSSASTAVLLSFGSAGMVDIQRSIFMILGMNIGTCITAVIASMGTSTNAKRTAAIHLMFNILGSIIFIIPLLLIKPEFIEKVLVFLSGNMLERQIANFHTLFNVIVTLVLLPFTNVIVSLATKIVRQKDKHGQSSKRLFYLDERIFITPPLAVVQSVKEVKNMGDLAMENLNTSLEMILSCDVSNAEEVKEKESIINYLNLEITNYLVKFASLDLSEKDDQIIASLYHVVADIERIGDYAENIYKSAIKMNEMKAVFSDSAQKEIVKVRDLLNEIYELTINAFLKRDKSLLPKIDVLEQEVDDMKKLMKKKHVERMSNGDCNIEAGTIYLSLASQLERTADHMTNIAYTIIPFEDKRLTYNEIKK